jgi:hypothetical protein
MCAVSPPLNVLCHHRKLIPAHYLFLPPQDESKSYYAENLSRERADFSLGK